MEPNGVQIYRFADAELDIVKGTLVRGGGDVHLRQKTFKVLAYLISHRDSDVSKDQLINDVWRETAVVDDVLVQSIKDIRRALGDDVRHPKFIRTIPKYGYRFIGDVEELHRHAKALDATPSVIAPAKTRGWRTFTVAAIGVVAIAVGLGFVLRSMLADKPKLGLVAAPGKATLSILFFENRSADAELDWLREGLTDMLITDLSRRDKIAVLSRAHLSELFERNGRDSAERITLNDALVVARTAKTASVLTGGFARIGERVRIDVQLFDATTGDLRGAESLTVDNAGDILTHIGSLSLRIAGHLGAGETAADASGLSAAMTNNLEAYRFYSLGVEKAQGLQNQEAIALLEKAVTLDPEFAMAHARIGYAYAVSSGLAEKGRPFLEKAFQLSSRLTEKDRLNISAWYAIAHLDYTAAINSYGEILAKYPDEIEAYWRLGRLLLGEEKYDDAIRVLKQGLAYQPEAKDIHNALGATYRDMGQHAAAIAATERYVLLAPNEPNAYDSLALALQAAGQYDKALQAYETALQLNPRFDVAILHRGNLYFQTGRYNDAINAYQTYIDLVASNRDKAWGWGRIAWVYRKKGDLAKASDAAAREIGLDPDAFENSMLVSMDSGGSKFTERLSATSKYNERGLRPSLRYFYYLKGTVALKENRPEESLEHFREALRRRPMIWDIDSFEDCLANAYFSLGRYDEAAAEYRRIFDANPNYPLANFRLAQTYERLGNTDKATENFRAFRTSWTHADTDIPELILAKKALGES